MNHDETIHDWNIDFDGPNYGPYPSEIALNMGLNIT